MTPATIFEDCLRIRKSMIDLLIEPLDMVILMKMKMNLGPVGNADVRAVFQEDLDFYKARILEILEMPLDNL